MIDGIAQSSYDPSAYPPFGVTVDVALFTIRGNDLSVLLVERGQEPFRGTWALPGGFVRVDEDLAAAAVRELAEETSISGGGLHLEQLGAYGTPDRDVRMRVVTVAHWGICASLSDPRGGGDAAVAELKPVREVELGTTCLAFDHAEIVVDALERMRSKLEYTALAARFCGPRFSITALREVYEAVWDKRLDPGNFQRNFRENRCFVECSQGVASPRSGRGRPASLWSVIPDEHQAPSVALLDRALAKR